MILRLALILCCAAIAPWSALAQSEDATESGSTESGSAESGSVESGSAESGSAESGGAASGDAPESDVAQENRASAEEPPGSEPSEEAEPLAGEATPEAVEEEVEPQREAGVSVDFPSDTIEASTPRPAVALSVPDVRLHLDFEEEEPVNMRRWSPPFALIPGLGLAHLVGGERRTGLRLMAAGLGGLGAVVVGGGGLLLSGASRRTVAVFTTVAALGISSFLLSTVADLAGSISRGRSAGHPMDRERYFLRAGFLYLEDKQFDYGPFLEMDARVRIGAVQLELGGGAALTHDNQRVIAGLRYFFTGEEQRGSTAFVRTSLRYHRFGSEGFAHLTGVVAIGGRLQLKTLGPSMRGLFVEGEWGVGFQGFGFRATGGGVGDTTNALLVLRTGIGVYLADRGELAFFYNHRRDGFAGAMSLNSVGAGAIGHVGLEGHGYFGGGVWGIGAEFKYGSAWVSRLMVQRRWW